MTDSHFTLERVLERFGTREALIDFLLDTEDVDKKKLMNIWVCFRKVYNELLPKSPSRRQDAVSIEAGLVWEVQKEQNLVFWVNLVRDVHAEHEARFPWYWQEMARIRSLPTAEQRKAARDALPKPKKRARKKRGSVEGEQTSRTRPAPYTVPGSSSSSRSRSRPSHSPSEPGSPSTSQASSSAASLFPTPPALPVHLSAQPSPMMPQGSHGGWQAPGVAPPMFSLGNAPLNGGQYMAPIHPAPVPVSAPLDMQMQNHTAWTNAAAVASYYHQPIPATAPLVPYHEIGFGYGTYQVGVAGDALLPAQASPFPSYQWASPGVQVAGFAFTPIPQPTRIRIRAKL